ncbi:MULTISPECIES: serine hydrolase domain-containing protein [unclassified Streptomyces]|uniref:serine hydrolase domain-containing protein n=1 Tax=unclassified Streptomyces TaxID=2593676 RepID=UPI003D00BA4E
MSEGLTEAGAARRALLAEGRERGLYSGAAWAVSTPDGGVDRGWFGTRAWDGPPLDGEEWWDLASVTKPVVGLVVMALADRGLLSLEAPLAAYLPRYRDTPIAPLTVEALLAHTSGLPGQVPMYRTHPTREALLDGLARLPLSGPPGRRVTYSSQGFMLLGLLAEAAGGEGLDVLVDRYVCAPLGLRGTRFGPVPPERAVATEECPWRGRVVRGEVHDENAVVLGGIAGHAGLFAPLADVEGLARSLAGGARELLRPATYARMTAPHTDGLNLRRALAWQGQDPGDASPVGGSFGPDAYGHTGFTGTSLWIDPATGRYAVLLTNRVHPSREERGFGALRKEFHGLGW